MAILLIIAIKLTKQSFIVSSTILLKDKNNSITSNENFDENLNLFRSKRNLENEISILRSNETLFETVKKLKINVLYYNKDLFTKNEIYGNIPFKIVYDTNHIQPTNLYIKVKFKKSNEFELTSSSKVCYSKLLKNDSLSQKIDLKIDFEGKWGEIIKTPYYSFILTPISDLIPIPGKSYGFVFQSDNDLALFYQEKIKIEQQGIESSIIKVYLESEVPSKDKDLINMLCNTYIQLGIKDKDKIAKNTIRYINEQLESIADSISGLNKKILSFHSGHKIVDVDMQTKYNYEKLSQLENERAALLAENKYCLYLFEYINSNTGKAINSNILAPSTSGIHDPLLERILNELTKLNQERSSLLFSANPGNPNLQMIDLKIEETKKTLTENVKSILETSKIRLDENMSNMLPIIKNLANMPVAEQHLVNVKRDYNHYDVLHDYLMKKKTEATIALASTTPHHSVLDKPKISKLPSKPNKRMLLMVFGLLSIFIPASFLVIKDSLNPIIYTKQDVLSNTSLRLLGSIQKLPQKGFSLVANGNNAFNEGIARLVQNLRKATEYSSSIVIGVGSFSKGEGKTFSSLSLASAFSEINLKVILIDFNFRNPEIGNLCTLKNQKTLNEYFEKKLTTTQVIIKQENFGFDTITSTKSENPRKLFTQEQLKFLLSDLKSMYQVVILDTSSIGVFSDYDFLLDYIDLNLFIVSKNKTKIKDLLLVEEFSLSIPSKSYFVLNKDRNSNISI